MNRSSRSLQHPVRPRRWICTTLLVAAAISPGPLTGCGEAAPPAGSATPATGSGGKQDNGASPDGGTDVPMQSYAPPAGLRPRAAGFRIGPDALMFLDQVAGRLVPTEVPLPNFDKNLAGCPFSGNQVAVHASHAVFHPRLDGLSTRLGTGTIGLDARLEGSGRVHLAVDACVTTVQCDIGLTLHPVDVQAQLGVTSRPDGEVLVSVGSPAVSLSPDVLAVDLSSCPGVQGLGHVGVDVNQIAGALASHFRPQLEAVADGLLAQNVAPAVQNWLQQQVVGAQSSHAGDLLGFHYGFSLGEVQVSPQGLDAYLDLGLSFTGTPVQCGQGQPSDLAVPIDALDVGHSPAAPFDVGVSFGFMEDVLYQSWQGGLLCIDDGKLAALGIDPRALLGGLPLGTQLSYQLNLTQPPGIGAQGSDLALRIRAAQLAVRVTLPGVDPIALTAEADLSAIAALGVDGQGTVRLRVDSLAVDRLSLTGDPTLAALGVGTDQVNALIQGSLLPVINQTVGQLPLSLSAIDVAGFSPEIEAVSVQPEGVYVGLGVR
jgi:hypothetical protein